MEKAAFHFTFLLQTYLALIWYSRFGIFLVRRVGNTSSDLFAHQCQHETFGILHNAATVCKRAPLQQQSTFLKDYVKNWGNESFEQVRRFWN